MLTGGSEEKGAEALGNGAGNTGDCLGAFGTEVVVTGTLGLGTGGTAIGILLGS